MNTFVQMTIFRNTGKSITLLDKVTGLCLILLNVYFYLSYESDPKTKGYKVLDMSSLFFQTGPGLFLLLLFCKLIKPSFNKFSSSIKASQI